MRDESGGREDAETQWMLRELVQLYEEIGKPGRGREVPEAHRLQL